jgi:hypothetical protein
MRSVAQSKQEKDPTYPCLMEGNGSGLIVLFYAENIGTVIHAGTDPFGIGYYASNWALSAFTEYTGEVVLSND